MSSRILAIIPARGGSKRLPHKNIMEFRGRPMICWTIDAARKSGIFDEIFISTDCSRTAEIGKDCGAAVPFLRDPTDADDMTPVWTATTNALHQFEQYRKRSYDVVVQLMANCPLRNSQDIRNAYDYYMERRLSFLISVFKYGWMNPWWALTVSAPSGEPTFLFPKARKRSQDLPELYCPSGAIWIADAAQLKRQKTFYGEGWRVFPLKWQQAFDIDDMDDYQMALALANQLFPDS